MKPHHHQALNPNLPDKSILMGFFLFVFVFVFVFAIALQMKLKFPKKKTF